MSTTCDQCGEASPADIHTCGAGVQAAMAHIVGEIDHAEKVWTPAQPAPVLPVAWRFTGIAGFKRFVTEAQYKAFSPEVRAWYEPFKCASCSTPPAQPAVPDAFGTREGEHPQYIQGWNDCRAEMLRGMKP
jgi:hypothetical protein